MLVGAATLLCWWAARMEPPAAAQTAPAWKWYKGNLHTHTLNSDGDSSPLDVATWYREHGYRFLVLSDHNYLTEVDKLNPVIAAREKFLLVQGEEVTARFQERPVHVNAIELSELILPESGSNLPETIRKNVDAIHKKGAIPSINHPNFQWAMTSRDLLQVDNMTHFEIYNGHPGVHNHGGGGAESLDQMWDALLTGGRKVYGVAVDDAHHFKQIGPGFSNPGRGWVMVKADALDAKKIADALRSGDFYASTGVELDAVGGSGNGLDVQIKQVSNLKFTTYFIGARGEVLERNNSLNPVYRFKGSETYVRARVEASNGTIAWTQPVWR
jgi:hypothetical protein